MCSAGVRRGKSASYETDASWPPRLGGAIVIFCAAISGGGAALLRVSNGAPPLMPTPAEPGRILCSGMSSELLAQCRALLADVALLDPFGDDTSLLTAPSAGSFDALMVALAPPLSESMATF